MNPTEMSDQDLAAAITHSIDSCRVLYSRRQELESEQRRRKSGERDNLFEDLLDHDRFGKSFHTQAYVSIRIPDSDWIEGAYDVQALVGKTNIFEDNSILSYKGHTYYYRFDHTNLEVFPVQQNSIEAWTILLSGSALTKENTIADYFSELCNVPLRILTEEESLLQITQETLQEAERENTQLREVLSSITGQLNQSNVDLDLTEKENVALRERLSSITEELRIYQNTMGQG